MTFFDFFLESINSDIVDTFNDVYEKYRDAIETLITKPNIYSESNIAFISEKSTRERISESFGGISKKVNSLFKNKLPQSFSFSQKKFIVNNISIINEIYAIYSEERVLEDKFLFIKKYYPNAFNKFCKNNGISITKLSKADKKKIVANKSKIQQEEPKIVAQLKHEKIVADFKKNILDKYPRQIFYKKFYSDYSSDEGMEFFLKHLDELDAFCKYMSEVVPFKALDYYTKDFLLSESRKEDDYIYLMSSSVILKFHRFARTKIDNEYSSIESTYPLGTKYFTESINSRTQWPYPKPTAPVFSPAIFGNQPHKSRWEIEQEHRKLEEDLRKAAIKYTIRFICITNKSKIKDLQILYSQVEELNDLYPQGYKLLIGSNPIKVDSDSTIPTPTRGAVIINSGEPAPLKGKSYVKYFSNLIKEKNLIRRLQALSEWQQKQLEFCKYVRDLRDTLHLTWGCYTYEFPFRGEVCDEASNFIIPDVNFKIWQFFIQSFCSADLDYTLCPKYSLANIDNESLESGRVTFKSGVYDKIKEFITSLNFGDYSPVVVFADTDDRWEIYHKSSHFLYLRSILQDDSIPEYERFGYLLAQDTSKKIIVVVDLITSNDQLKSFASDILGGINDTNLIVYLSLRKEYSKEEMQSIIAAEQKKIDDKKAAEEAEKLKLRREREQQEHKQQEIDRLRSIVANWNQPSRSSLPYFSLYYYYPTTCDWNASEDEWDVRNLIWDFKANPNRPQSLIEIKARHERAVNEIIPDLKRVILRYFGALKSKLTLVCIPSSKKIVTERRYKDFSEKLCNEIGMTNGYSFIHVVEDGDASHLGGGVQAQFSVDSSFFKDRYVILFDDVITSGKSMERFKRMLESVGATVICGISIGKTKHERQESNPIDGI